MRKSASVVVEVLALIFIVGLAVAVAVPDSDRDQPAMRLRALITSLETVRTALDRYWGDHGATYPTPEEINGLRNPPHAFRFRSGLAAYLDRIPDNPFTKGNSVGLITTPAGSSDWIYDPRAGVFKANDSEENRAL